MNNGYTTPQHPVIPGPGNAMPDGARGDTNEFNWPDASYDVRGSCGGHCVSTVAHEPGCQNQVNYNNTDDEDSSFLNVDVTNHWGAVSPSGWGSPVGAANTAMDVSLGNNANMYPGPNSGNHGPSFGQYGAGYCSNGNIRNPTVSGGWRSPSGYHEWLNTTGNYGAGHQPPFVPHNGRSITGLPLFHYCQGQ
ncbi:Uu.00g098910.m01.CDS01 [Anthostomella pinea]|uniref:Uu.00g098910.m01.CDS01 n=1 Tax=Anthostomella pinea TaxID=933095 RepID=A0AAI8VDD2_9PEZI|nr:Uu.00g098910.m01.CDS01 [Anthostomella pinea]